MRIMYVFIKYNERILKILLAQHFLRPFLSVVNGRLRIESVIFLAEISFYVPKNADHENQFAGKYEASDW